MGVDKWKKVIAYLNKVKADPDKVYRLLETAYSKGRRDNNYQMIRASWKIDVVARIFNKFGTTKKNRIPLKQIIRNWVKSDDYVYSYNLFHYPLTKKTLTKAEIILDLERHVKNCNDHWLSKTGKAYRRVLQENQGKFPVNLPIGSKRKN